MMVVLTAHLDRVGRYLLEGPADVCAEFVSEHTTENDLRIKLHEDETAGVPEFVAMETREERDGVRILRPDELGRYQRVMPDEHGRYHSQVIAGFWFDPAWFEQQRPTSVGALLLQIAPEVYRRHLAELLADGSNE